MPQGVLDAFLYCKTFSQDFELTRKKSFSTEKYEVRPMTFKSACHIAAVQRNV